MNATCYTRTIGPSIVLFARIVNGAGQPIRPLDIAAIEYSVREHDPCRRKTSLVEHSRTRLAASAIISPELVRGDLWAVDDVGYNFRHDIGAGVHVTQEFTGRLQVRYVFTQIDNTRSTVRFHLKLL